MTLLSIFKSSEKHLLDQTLLYSCLPTILKSRYINKHWGTYDDRTGYVVKKQNMIHASPSYTAY